MMQPHQLSAILQHAPAWARLGLGASDAVSRQHAANVLAAVIVEYLGEPAGRETDDQLLLPL